MYFYCTSGPRKSALLRVSANSWHFLRSSSISLSLANIALAWSAKSFALCLANSFFMWSDSGGLISSFTFWKIFRSYYHRNNQAHIKWQEARGSHRSPENKAMIIQCTIKLIKGGGHNFLFENGIILFCNNLGPLHQQMLCVKFGWNSPHGSEEESFKILLMYFCYFVLIFGKGNGPSFEEIWIPFSQKCFVPSLVDIRPMVFEKKMKIWKIYRQTDGQHELSAQVS